ncbi:hypothetical protein SynA1560_01896 [Synechococcus sp. A15-60]|nr:hypothetical protein SynA1560_01896 [Synechococcus sp. A15-60]
MRPYCSDQAPHLQKLSSKPWNSKQGIEINSDIQKFPFNWAIMGTT